MVKKTYIISISAMILGLISVLLISKLHNLHLTIISIMIFLGIIILMTVIVSEAENVKHLLLIIYFTQNRVDMSNKTKERVIKDYINMTTSLQRKIYKFEYGKSLDDIMEEIEC